jgi:hypothetical protein
MTSYNYDDVDPMMEHNDDELDYHFEDDYGDEEGFDQSFPNDYGYEEDEMYGTSNPTPSIKGRMARPRRDDTSSHHIGSVGVGASFTPPPHANNMNSRRAANPKSPTSTAHHHHSTNANSNLASANTTSNNNTNTVGGIKSSLASSVEVDDKPRILLMGLRRSGKSSIQKVVFQKMSPHETLFLESTNKIVKNG